MLSEILKHRIKNVDVLSDFDKTMIRKESAYRELFAYFSYLPCDKRVGLLRRLVKNFQNCKKRDLVFFYSLFKGCPIEVIDKTVDRNRQNENWDELIDKENFGEIGTVSQNNYRIISGYLNLKKSEEQHIKVKMVAANEPEIVDGIYTGKVTLNVTKNNLIDFVREKDFIHGVYEKRILESFEDSGIHIINVGYGLYIATKQKYFINNFLNSRNTYK